jgi:HPt (histidine-containing phosphotransfer) domain-containing protein
MHPDHTQEQHAHALDLSRLQYLRGLGPRGESLADKAVAEFLNTGPQHLWELRRAAVARASDQLLHEVSLLKGMALLTGAMGVAAQCVQIDRAGRDKHYGVVRTAISELARELALAEEALRQQDQDRP